MHPLPVLGFMKQRFLFIMHINMCYINDTSVYQIREWQHYWYSGTLLTVTTLIVPMVMRSVGHIDISSLLPSPMSDRFRKVSL